jgi:hypothetical protein
MPTSAEPALDCLFVFMLLLGPCRRPYECGEVAVQPYNSILSLAHLSSHADGVLLVDNDGLNATCTKQLGIQRPSLADLNSVAARNLASVLLPSLVRPAQAAGGGAGVGTGARRYGGGGCGPAGRGGRAEWDSSWDAVGGGSSGASGGGESAGAWDGSFGSGSRWDDGGGGSSSSSRRSSKAAAGGGRPPGVHGKPGQLRMLGDVCEQLCAHPSYRLLTLRSVPQVRRRAGDE